MAVKVVSSNIGSDLILLIEQIIQNHYSHNLNHYYEATIYYYLQPNYTTLVLYNILDYSWYPLGVVVLAGS